MFPGVHTGADGQEQDGGIEQGDEDGCLLIAVGIFFRWSYLQQTQGDKGHGEGSHVGEVMSGVGKQGKRMDAETDDDFDQDKKEVENDTDDERAVYLSQIDGMMVVANSVRMIVGVGVIVGVSGCHKGMFYR